MPLEGESGRLRSELQLPGEQLYPEQRVPMLQRSDSPGGTSVIVPNPQEKAGMEMARINLYEYQLDAIERMKNGCVLCGGVGSGKSLTAISYYYLENGG
jgi:ATP-dependent helicase YprA (DUF1998 family)